MFQRFCLTVFCSLLALSAPLKESPAQTRAPSATLLEGAKKEGEVVFYTPLNINDSRPLLQRFEQRFPFIKTELLRLSAEPLLNRIFTEDRAGRNVVDDQQHDDQSTEESPIVAAVSIAGARGVFGSFQRSRGLLGEREQ